MAMTGAFGLGSCSRHAGRLPAQGQGQVAQLRPAWSRRSRKCPAIRASSSQVAEGCNGSDCGLDQEAWAGPSTISSLERLYQLSGVGSSPLDDGLRSWPVFLVSVDEKPPTKNQEKCPDYYANVGDAIRTLREDVPALFERELNCEFLQLLYGCWTSCSRAASSAAAQQQLLLWLWPCCGWNVPRMHFATAVKGFMLDCFATVLS
jgi:hypothetical protein